MHASISDIIADTAQNSIEAGAKRVSVSLTERDGTIAVEITDDGKGMSEETKRKVFDPFYTEPGKHDARKVGLGLPILKQTCEECEGGLTLESELGKGTRLEYHFKADNIDLPPMGDVADMVLTLFNYPGDFELVFRHVRGENEYEISRSELIDAVGELNSVDSLSLAREFLKGQEEM